MQWKIDTNTTDEAFDLLIKLLCKILPEGNLAPGSLHLFNKVFEKMDVKHAEWHMCSKPGCQNPAIWPPLPKSHWQIVEKQHVR